MVLAHLRQPDSGVELLGGGPANTVDTTPTRTPWARTATSPPVHWCSFLKKLSVLASWDGSLAVKGGCSSRYCACLHWHCITTFREICSTEPKTEASPRRIGIVGIPFHQLPVTRAGCPGPGSWFSLHGRAAPRVRCIYGWRLSPNHKGMPLIPHDSKIDFLSRQVLTSRNIRGGKVVDWAMGGLNYQIEHHLFPRMPSAHLPLVQPMVRQHCEERSIPYTEAGLIESYAIVVKYLNRVGLGYADPMECPMVSEFRPQLRTWRVVSPICGHVLTIFWQSVDGVQLIVKDDAVKHHG